MRKNAPACSLKVTSLPLSAIKRLFDTKYRMCKAENIVRNCRGMNAMARALDKADGRLSFLSRTEIATKT